MPAKLRFATLFAASLFCASLLSPSELPAEMRTGALIAHPARPSGVASWYGEELQGCTMANGRQFDRFQLTAASWSLPLGMKIRVINIENGRSVVVTITDRGPAPRLHRILDLSQAAAERLGYTERGLAHIYYTPAPMSRRKARRTVLSAGPM